MDTCRWKVTVKSNVEKSKLLQETTQIEKCWIKSSNGMKDPNVKWIKSPKISMKSSRKIRQKFQRDKTSSKWSKNNPKHWSHNNETYQLAAVRLAWYGRSRHDLFDWWDVTWWLNSFCWELLVGTRTDGHTPSYESTKFYWLSLKINERPWDYDGVSMIVTLPHRSRIERLSLIFDVPRNVTHFLHHVHFVSTADDN